MSIITEIKRFIEKAFKVTDEDDEITLVDYALAFISGAAIGYVLFKLLKGDNYTCPNCGFTRVPNNAITCPNCGRMLSWQ